tara:strand:- start:363 stop:953 length:591 start_codon:yes stop_codon:yes gene_type:complete
MARKCKCGCLAELPPIKECTDRLSECRFASFKCIAAYEKAKREAKEAKAIKKRNTDLRKKVKANPKAKALEAAQLLARISRADDDGYCTCVTCGHVGKWNEGFDGGHFIAKGNCSYWMLDPRNIWPQCKSCNGNGMKFGNKEADYTLFMIDEFGREFVDRMKSMEKTIIRRSSVVYDEFISVTHKEINEHKKRIGV